MQRLLGVDHIQIMDLNNSEPIHRVFKHYTDLGLLNLLPYHLPGNYRLDYIVIQIMDLKNSEPIHRVFKYYTDLGLLNLLPCHY